ncbi:putative membrane protein [Rhizobium sp. PP-F2F-G38]|nr:putative membrane protein [Rhizobium sp. PP-WC-1G-195]PYE99445.1 putative membrane protein [Rhizobium sp. PP-F2F-G38]
MKTYLIAYAGTLLSFLVVDAVWLGLVARTFYRDQLGDLMSPQPNLTVAAVFYLFFAAAIVILAVLPGLRAGSMMTTIGYGAVLGLAAYGTYDITNLSTLRNWPAMLSVVDMIWGTFLTALGAACGLMAVRWLGDATA